MLKSDIRFAKGLVSMVDEPEFRSLTDSVFAALVMRHVARHYHEEEWDLFY